MRIGKVLLVFVGLKVLYRFFRLFFTNVGKIKGVK